MKSVGFAPRNVGKAPASSKLTPASKAVKGKAAKPQPAITLTRTMQHAGQNSNDIAKSFDRALRQHQNDNLLNLYL